jgi:hypothetical protein
MTMETDTMMMVAIMVLMPNKLRFSFLFVNVHLRFSSERSFDNVTVTAYN